MAQKKIKEGAVLDKLTIENARLIFRNFSGKEGKFNAKGIRNFCVILTQEDADKLSKDKWNIRYLEPREDGEARVPYMQVKVHYGPKPPKIIVVNTVSKTYLEEDTVHVLDWAEIANVDMIINPYNWEVKGDSGVKGYLKVMYVTLVEDEFAKKYRDIPDAGVPLREIEEEDD